MANGPTPGDAAPTWKSYLAIRSERKDSSTTPTALRASRKRAQPVASVAPRVRAFWEQLSVSARQHVLFIDEPELVKQLYKLNLSLLCVGLMQRHLKAKPPRTVAAIATATAVEEAKTATAAATVNAHTRLESDGTKAKGTTADALAAEKTYELLEAMEFMDIGTGILTVKSELVETPERLFALVSDVLVGFASSLYVLSEAQFHALFVVESEAITSWDDYQRLIAMLVEQLILKSYVRRLEHDATAQMEALLLEEGRHGEAAGPTVDRTVSIPSQSSVNKQQKKKTKKQTKRKKRDGSGAVETERRGGRGHSGQPEPEDFDDSEKELNESGRPTASSEDDLALASGETVGIDEKEEEMDDIQAFPDSTGDVSRLGNIASPEKRSDHRQAASRASTRAAATSSLNPNAVAFEPFQAAPASGSRSLPPVGAKRKLDSFVVRIDADDALSDDEFDWRQDLSPHYSKSDDEIDMDDSDDSDGGARSRRQKVARWREGDAALAWQLQHIYATMSAAHGWDFATQREIVVEPSVPGAAVPWDDLALWRTAPTQVVRYFGSGLERGSDGNDSSYSSYFPSPPEAYPFAGAAATAVGASGRSAQPSESRFYFAPSSPVAISSAYLSPHASSATSSNRRAGGRGSRLSPLLLPPPAPVPTTTSSSSSSSSTSSSSRGAARLGSRRRGFRSIVGE